MTQYIQVLTSVGAREDGEKLARTVVEQRLAACVQVIGPVASTYWWHGEVESATEWLCLMKTERALYEELEAAIRAAHSYETPEIVAIPVEGGSEDYLAWLSGEVRSPRSGS